MALLDFLKGKNQPAVPVTFPVCLGAAANGKFVAMTDIPDPVFSEGVLGLCCGIDPTEGKVYAPIDGKITQVADTSHAIGIQAGEIEILIHIGVDTVDMKGDGFACNVKLGQNIKKGDLLVSMDLDKIHAAGHASTVIMIVTNSDDFASVEPIDTDTVNHGDNVLRINK